MFYMTDLAEQLQVIPRRNRLSALSVAAGNPTERDMMRDFETCSRTIEVLHSKGYKIAIDDFAMGYSSLSVLKICLADCVKLDRSFIEDINSSKVDYDNLRGTQTFANTGFFSDSRRFGNSKPRRDPAPDSCKYAQGYFLRKAVAD
ncbi:EAL domain-containing protein [Vibrio lentus]|nr:EAL domain-containing protein [Vibrio lentus]